MIISVAINGILGLAMTIAALFCIGDLDEALNSPEGFPFMEIFLSATNSVAGATAMVSSNLPMRSYLSLRVYCLDPEIFNLIALSTRIRR